MDRRPDSIVEAVARAYCELLSLDPDFLEPGSQPYEGAEHVDGTVKGGPAHFTWRGFVPQALRLVTTMADWLDLPDRPLTMAGDGSVGWRERTLRGQWQDRTIRAEMLLRRCVALGALPCELRRQIAAALDPRPCGCGPTDGCEKCRKPGALYQAIVRLWFRRPDGSAPNPLTDPPDEEAGVMQPTREGTAAFLSEIVLRHWDEKCGCQGDG